MVYIGKLDISGVTTDLDEEAMKAMPPWVHLIKVMPPQNLEKEPPKQ